VSIGNGQLKRELALQLAGSVEPGAETIATVDVTHGAQYVPPQATCQYRKLPAGQFSVKPCIFAGLSLSAQAVAAVGFPLVTVQDAFRASLAILLRHPAMNKRRAAAGADMSASYLGRLASGQMQNPTLSKIEQLRAFLDLEPRDLFDPDRALARIRQALNAEPGGLVADDLDAVRPATEDRLPQHQPEGGEGHQVQHDPLLSALVHVWPWLTEDARREIAQKVIAHTPTTETEGPVIASTALPSTG
jgi:transcriptional regulator with XRE-family HTH domain